MESDKRIIEINGIKLEVDLRTAVRIDTLQIGSRVKVLVKDYSETKVYPGVVIGFEPFPTKPSIVVAYMKTDYSGANIIFKSYNSDSTDFEIVADLDLNALEVDKAHLLNLFDREMVKKENEWQEIAMRRQFFLDKFNVYFKDMAKEDSCGC